MHRSRVISCVPVIPRVSLLALALVACAPPVASRVEPLPSARDVASTAPSPSPARRAPRPGPIERYAVELTLDVANHRAVGVATLTLARSIQAVDLDAKALDVSSIEVSERGGAFVKTAFRHEANRLHVDVGTPSEGRAIRVRYTTRPSEGLVVTEDEAYTAFDTRDWLPCDFDPGHKAPLDLRVTVPDGWHVVGAETIAPAVGHVALEVPHSAYLFGFAAGRYVRSDGASTPVALHFEAPKALVDARPTLAPLVLDEMAAAAALFERWSGRAYEGHDYAMVATKANGGQEAAFLSLGSVEEFEAFADEPTEDWLVVHELAHMWWGNALTCDRWADFWLNEAFAVFMTAAVKERRFGRPGYDAEVALAWKKFDRRVEQGKDRALVGDDGTDADHAGGPIVYSKGALVLFELRAKLGEEAFWDGIHRYSEAGSVVRTEDLAAAMERASGVSLDTFFSAWTTGLGAPTNLTRPR